MKTTRDDSPRSIEIVLPEADGVPDAKIVVGPVGIDDAISAWSYGEAGGEWILDWLKNEGDTVTIGEPVALLRGASGQGDTAMRSPADGVLTEIRATRGIVEPGAVLAVVSAPATTADVEILETSNETLIRQHGDFAPAAKLVNVILISAIEKGATHIRIEPHAEKLLVRYRIDGVFYDIMQPPLKMRDVIASRIKLLAKLDVLERHVSQHGRMTVRLRNNDEAENIEMHVSCQPTGLGENIIVCLPGGDDVV